MCKFEYYYFFFISETTTEAALALMKKGDEYESNHVNDDIGDRRK